MKPHDRAEAGSHSVECEPNHTPGPWGVAGPMIHGMKHVIVRHIAGRPTRPTLIVAHVDDLDGFEGNKEGASLANARLIAAAPELLKALMTICGMHELSYRVPNGSVDPFDTARAAIAKATRAALSKPATEPDREAKRK